MLAHQTISASEFKAKCLDIFDRLSTRDLTRVTITKRGRVVAILMPPDDPVESVRQIYGCMKGSVVGLEGYDLTEPVIEGPFAAEMDELDQ